MRYNLFEVWLSPMSELIVVWPYGVQWKTIRPYTPDMSFSRSYLRTYKRWLKSQGYEKLGWLK